MTYLDFPAEPKGPVVAAPTVSDCLHRPDDSCDGDCMAASTISEEMVTQEEVNATVKCHECNGNGWVRTGRILADPRDCEKCGGAGTEAHATLSQPSI